MKLSLILEVVKNIAGQLAPFVPYAQWAMVGASVVGAIVNIAKQPGTKVTDENGNTLSPEQLEARALETWSRVDAKLAAIAARAEGEIQRARGPQ